MAIPTDRIERIKASADRGPVADGASPGLPALPGVPGGRYRSAEFADLERTEVFGRSWLFVAHIDQLAEPGDYLTLDQLGHPVFLVRDDDRVRAFSNTCQHRGSALVLDHQGNTGRRLTCPFHNWVYGLDGTLLGLPGAEDFDHIDRDCLALRPHRCETWGPLIFLNLDPDAEPLADALAEVGRDLSTFDDLTGTLRLADHTTVDVAANWKLPVDANLETYHVNYLHRETAAGLLDQDRTGIQLLSNGHSRMLIRLRHDIEADLDMGFPPIFDGIGDLPISGTFSYHLFPNLSIVFSGRGFVFLITNWPTGPTTSRYDVHWCSSLDPETHRGFLDKVIAVSQTILHEDLQVMGPIQASIDAGALDQIRLGHPERRLYHLQEAIDRAIGPDRVPPELRVEPLLHAFIEE